jgi:hypothetical protein
MTEPVKLSKNDILRKHGPFGGLVRSLQRYALLGWILFGVTLMVLLGVSVVHELAPRPVVAVDESGRVLGVFEYLSPATRSDEEITAACKRFAVGYLSLNSETIFEDYAEAMNMMDDQMLADTQAALAKDNYLARVKAAKSRSRLEFAPRHGAVVIARRGLEAECRLAGDILIDAGDKSAPTPTPFDMTLGVRVVARNSANTAGLKVSSRKDN